MKLTRRGDDQLAHQVRVSWGWLSAFGILSMGCGYRQNSYQHKSCRDFNTSINTESSAFIDALIEYQRSHWKPSIQKKKRWKQPSAMVCLWMRRVIHESKNSWQKGPAIWVLDTSSRWGEFPSLNRLNFSDLIWGLVRRTWNESRKQADSKPQVGWWSLYKSMDSVLN